MIKLLDILQEMIVNQPEPGVYIKQIIPRLPVLDLKIGKYDVAKGRRGRAVPFNSKHVSSSTRNRVNKVFNKLGIKPEKTYIAWMVDDEGRIYSLKSTFVVSSYKGEPIIIAQTQTSHAAAGQIYLYSKYFKSGKKLTLPEPGKNIDDSSIFADENATTDEILKALKYDNL